MKAEFTILEPNFFIKHIKVIAEFLDESLIRFSDKIRIVGLDPSRIAVIELLMDNDYIKTTNKKEIEAPVSLDSISKIMKRFSNPDELYIICDEESQAVIIKGKINNRTKTFRSQMIDLDMGDFEDPIPSLSKIKYDVVFPIEANIFKDILKDAEIFSEFIIIETLDDGINIFAENSSGECNSKLERDDLGGYTKCSYSIKMLNNIINPIGNTNLLIMLKTDHPIALYDKLSAKSHMLYYLAPRILRKEDD